LQGLRPSLLGSRGNTGERQYPPLRTAWGKIPLTMMDGVVNRQFPNEAAPIIDCLVQQNTFLPYPEMNLSITLKFRKPPEYDLYSFAHSGIGINIDSIVPDLYIAPHA
jgi:hypothetical protein